MTIPVRAFTIAVTLSIAVMCAADTAPDTSPIPGVKTAPVTVTWELTPKGDDKTAHKMLQATFTVADPTKVAMLWYRPGGALPFSPGGGITGLRGDVTLNSKAFKQPNGSDGYAWMPIDPAGRLVAGKNVLVIPIRGAAPKLPWRLIAAAPQPVPITAGPMLGHIGKNFYSVTCQTPIPAEVALKTWKTKGPGMKVAPLTWTTVKSPAGMYHRFRAEFPGSTEAFRYTLTTTAGGHTKTVGPFEVKVPGADGQSLRFVAIGNTRCHKYSDKNLPLLVAAMQKERPEVFIHAGHIIEFPKDFYRWQWHFFPQLAPLLRTIPFYVAPDIDDNTGHMHRAFTLPYTDARAMNWTAVHGPVRFIGLGKTYQCGPGSATAKWLEEVLKNAREKFVFVVAHYPAYSSGRMNRKPMNYSVTRNARQVIQPLLAKYKATALISAQDFHYERCEPTADKGVTQLVIGGGGAKVYRQSNRASRANPFTGTGVFSYSSGFCIFVVKGDTCTMRYIPVIGSEKEGPPDTKVFKARATAPR